MQDTIINVLDRIRAKTKRKKKNSEVVTNLKNGINIIKRHFRFKHEKLEFEIKN